MTVLSVTAKPSAADLDTIFNGLNGFNEHDVGPADRLPLVVLLHDADRLVGGLSGFTAWGWLYIQWLWLDQAHRGQGLAAQMLAEAETEARKRGCQSAWIDTFNPIALKAYTRAGYTPFGELQNFPKGRTRTFLQKHL